MVRVMGGLSFLVLGCTSKEARCCFSVAEQRLHLGLLAAAPAVEQLDDPLFVNGGHAFELAPADGRQAHGVGAPIARVRRAQHKAFGFELVGDAGDVAAGDHQTLRQLAHRQALGVALELREQVETRQRGAELAAQPAAHHALDPRGARQQAQPELERLVVVGEDARFQVGLRQGLGSVHHTPCARLACSCGVSVALCTSSERSRSRLRSSWFLPDRYCTGQSAPMPAV